MNPELKRINDVYRSIEHFWNDDKIPLLSEEELTDYIQARENAIELYTDTVNQVSQLVEKLAVDELIEAYKEGCKLLKANLGGYMYLHFDQAYVPTMIEAINNDDDGSYLYLGILSKHLAREAFIPLVLKALQSRLSRTCDTALSYTRHLQIVEAMPLVENIAESKVHYIEAEAKMTLDILQNLSE